MTMKKHIRMCFEFFYKNKLKAVAMFIIMLSASFMFINMFTEYDYYREEEKYFSDESLKKSDFLTVYSTFENYWFDKKNWSKNNNQDVSTDSQNGNAHIYETEGEEVEIYNKAYADFIKKDIYSEVKKFPQVENVYSYTTMPIYAVHYNSTNAYVYFSDTDTYKRFNYKLSDGCWFQDYKKEESKYPEAVVSGSGFANVNVGDDIEIKYLDNKDKKKIHVIGKVAPPYATIDFKGYFSDVLSYENKVFFLNNKKTEDMFGESINQHPTDAIVVYKKSADKNQIQECRDYYSSFFPETLTDLKGRERTYKGYESTEIRFEESEYILNMHKENTIFSSIVILGAATVMFVIIAILMVKKKQHEYNIYRICGCNNKQSFLYSLIGMMFICFITGLICTVYLVVLSYRLSNGLEIESNRFVGADCYILMWLYLIVTTAISTIVPYIMVFRKKMTLMTLYRKNK